MSFSAGGWKSSNVSVMPVVEVAVGPCRDVERSSCLCHHICPLSVAGDVSGRYYLTATAVNPGHVVKWFCWKAQISVVSGGLNRD